MEIFLNDIMSLFFFFNLGFKNAFLELSMNSKIKLQDLNNSNLQN